MFFNSDCILESLSDGFNFTLFSEPFLVGGQPDDDRIFVEERQERAPDYTEGEE